MAPTSEESDSAALPGSTLEADRMPGHWLLARLGKRVLRPGGVELTNHLIESLGIGSADDVVELAPGLGSTTELVLARNPRSYTGVDRDEVAARRVGALAAGENRKVVQGSAASTGLDAASADVMFGEAYLTMQPASQKQKIVAEISRVVRPGGRIGIHEVAFAPDDIAESDAASVSDALTANIKVNVTPLTIRGWTELLESAGFRIDGRFTAPLHLLEPRRLVADEGVRGALRFLKNVLSDSDARRRVIGMRRAMHDNRDHLQACVLTATRIDG